MKCRDFDLYRMHYCGLCRRLRRDYGLIPPMFLSYDFTFLAMLLWNGADCTPCRGRCTANPLRKECMCPDSPALELAAAECVILTWWKARDSIKDEHGMKALEGRVMSALLNRACRKAREKCPSFYETAGRCLEELDRLEQEQCPSLDRTADTFARILQACVPEDMSQQRVLRQILYHLGRWIYLADARDDLAEDREKDRYNPLRFRYGEEADDGALALTMSLSLDQIGAAFQLGSFGLQRAALENIIYLGLPLVQRSIFEGSWSQIKKQKIWSSAP